MSPVLAGILLATGADYAGLFLAFAFLPLAGTVITWTMIRMPRVTQHNAEK